MAHRRAAHPVSDDVTLDEIKQLIEFIKGHDLSEFELEQDGVKIRIKSGSNHNHMVAMPHLPAAMPVMTVAPGVLASPVSPTAPASPASAASPASPEAEGGELAIVKSPIVGTFYKSPSPTSEAFASVGDFVEKGTVVCIIEAMKLMNEIESDVAGEIVSVLVENGQPVEYGEKLFAIRPR